VLCERFFRNKDMAFGLWRSPNRDHRLMLQHEQRIADTLRGSQGMEMVLDL
jgi:hypothetical protein